MSTYDGDGWYVVKYCQQDSHGVGGSIYFRVIHSSFIKQNLMMDPESSGQQERCYFPAMPSVVVLLYKGPYGSYTEARTCCIERSGQ